MVEVTPEDGYYLNYPEKLVKRDRIRFIRELTPCKVRAQFMLQDGQYRERNP